MDATVVAGLLGGIGGLTRGVVGLLKALSLRRKILWGYYLITITIALIIGVFVGIVFNFDPRLSLLAGLPSGLSLLAGLPSGLSLLAEPPSGLPVCVVALIDDI